MSYACPVCHQVYENIGHPLKPGVIMMRVCGCKGIPGGGMPEASKPTRDEELTRLGERVQRLEDRVCFLEGVVVGLRGAIDALEGRKQ